MLQQLPVAIYNVNYITLRYQNSQEIKPGSIWRNYLKTYLWLMFQKLVKKARPKLAFVNILPNILPQLGNSHQDHRSLQLQDLGKLSEVVLGEM